MLEVGREVAEGERGHVVHRRRHEVHGVAARLDVVAQQVSAEDLHPRFGIERGERALDCLRAPGGARGVLHELPGHPVRGRPVGLAGQHGLVRGEAVDRAPHRDASGHGHAGLDRRRTGHRGESPVRHERLRAGVAQDVGDLGRREIAVQGNEVPARLEQGHQHLNDLGPVRQQGGHRVALAQAPLAQRVHETVGPCRDLARRPLPARRVDHGDAVRLGRRGRPEAPGR